MSASGSRTISTLLTYTLFQFRSVFRTAIYWAAGLCLYAGLVVLIYPSVKDAINIEAVPANLRAAFNINDFTQLATFLSSELFGVILPLVLPFFGMIVLSDIVAGAEERGRLDILLGNPIPRWHLIAGSFIVIASYLAAIVFLVGLVVWMVARLQDLELTMVQSMRATFALWPLGIAFGALSLALSAFVRRRSVALGVPAAVVFLMYLVNVIGRLAPDVSGIRYASAYHYYGTAITEGIWWAGMAVLLATTATLVALAVYAFNHRDIYA